MHNNFDVIPSHLSMTSTVVFRVSSGILEVTSQTGNHHGWRVADRIDAVIKNTYLVDTQPQQPLGKLQAEEIDWININFESGQQVIDSMCSPRGNEIPQHRSKLAQISVKPVTVSSLKRYMKTTEKFSKMYLVMYFCTKFFQTHNQETQYMYCDTSYNPYYWLHVATMYPVRVFNTQLIWGLIDYNTTYSWHTGMPGCALLPTTTFTLLFSLRTACSAALLPDVASLSRVDVSGRLMLPSIAPRWNLHNSENAYFDVTKHH